MNRTTAVFITGTDTSVGKTFIAALLFGFLRKKGLDAGYQKWISSGGHDCDDLRFCLEKNGLPCPSALLNLQAPYRFLYPASPHLAAEREQQEIDPDFILERFKEYARQKEIIVVEGVGGVMVPLRRDLLLADFLARIRVPMLVVARSGLGTINHTLLTLEALRSRNIPILGVIFSDDENDSGFDEMLLEDNQRVIVEMGQVQVFGRLKRCLEFSEAQEAFEPMGRLILQVMQGK